MGPAPLAHGKKNARRRRAWLVFEDESGVAQQPVVRRTWAPRGQTPVLTHTRANWQRLSVAGALAFPDVSIAEAVRVKVAPGMFPGITTLKIWVTPRPG